MSIDPSQLPKEIRDILANLPELHKAAAENVDVKEDVATSEKLVDAIEMIGEEKAAGFDTAKPSEVTPGMRYLHSSRTIHQLVTDRNRAVGIYLAVASLLLTASGATLNANPRGGLIVTIEEIQRWCLPVTFGALSILAVFMAFLLIRTRVGLIYEVAKMNVFLGLPIGRVQRINPLSIHFILQALISCAGGASAALFSIFMIRLEDAEAVHKAVWIGVLIGIVVAALLIALDMVTIIITTADHRLQWKTTEK